MSLLVNRSSHRLYFESCVGSAVHGSIAVRRLEMLHRREESSRERPLSEEFPDMVVKTCSRRVDGIEVSGCRVNVWWVTRERVVASA
jgi:hypothetical protein